MLKRRLDGQELGELVSTARNTYANAGSVAQFDFHQSDKSKLSFPLLSFLSSDTSKGLPAELARGPDEQKVNQLLNTKCNK
jgi:hypothetical protein